VIEEVTLVPLPDETGVLTEDNDDQDNNNALATKTAMMHGKQPMTHAMPSQRYT
jgi:hypothetical protein